uniref:Dehydrogenase n=1 Tax=Phlebotomus papatasi TaxID=29031 RepID=A0A1B0DCB8_PHLPP
MPMKCDVSKEDEIIAVFAEIDRKFNGIDVLINNAGTGKFGGLLDKDNSSFMRHVIDTNILGIVFCTREAYKSMEKHGRNSHIIHINSILGHIIPPSDQLSPSSMYIPSKFAVTAMTEIHRQEFIRSKHHIKVTSVSPGYVKTPIVPQELLEQYPDLPLLEPEDIAHSVLYVLGTPPHVQVHELTIKPFGETF